MRVALYARVSSGRQEQERTIASQLEALRAYAAAHDHQIVAESEFLDDGFSGARLDRPALDRLRDGARAGNFEAVLVLDPDRMSRKYAYQVLILEELERFGVSVVFLEQPPLDDPSGRLLVQIQGAVAEYERAKIAERNRRGRLYRLRQGEASVSACPYGYRRIPRTAAEPAHLVIDEDKAAVVRQMFDWHVNERLSLRKIGQRLNARGVPTPRGGALWTAGNLWPIMRNPAYIGTWILNRTRTTERGKELRPEDEWITVAVPAIISRELFLESQRRHEENKQFSPRRLKDEERWLLRGLLRCALCGHAIICVRTSSKGSCIDYYRCRYIADTLTPCRAPYIRAADLDDFVWNEVRRTLSDPAVLEQAAAGGATVSTDASLLQAQMATLQKRLQAAQKERQRLVDAYQAGTLELPELEPRLAALRLRQEQAEVELHRLSELNRQNAAEQDLLERLDLLAARVRGEIDTLTFKERQGLLREVIQKIDAAPYAVTLRYRIPLPVPPAPPGPEGPHPAGVSTELCLRQDRRAVLQVDQAAPAHQDLLRYLGQRGSHPDLDRHLRVPARGHRPETPRDRKGPLHNSTDPERLCLRESPSRTGAFGRGLHSRNWRYSQPVVTLRLIAGHY